MAVALTVTSVSAADGEIMYQRDVFISGLDGYDTYRIPAVLVTPQGTVLAFCEGRRSGRGDSGNIDLVLKRSFDGGYTWGPMAVIADDGPNTMGNPCPVFDRTTGTIWLLLTRNLGHDHESQIIGGTSEGSRTVWVMKSTDDGVSWSKPVEITETTKAPNWTWYATGPGVGIQLRSGRLLIPCDNALAGSKGGEAFYSHVIYSDDHGATWKLGGMLDQYTNECQVIERIDGSLLLNMRSYHGKNCRAIATSDDEGMTWSEVTLDETLPEPICQASLLRYTQAGVQDRNRVLFSNPPGKKREKMTVRLSYDEGASWPVSRLLYKGLSAYSCLTVLPDMSIGCFYERDSYSKITFARFSLGWLTEGADCVDVGNLGASKSVR